MKVTHTNYEYTINIRERRQPTEIVNASLIFALHKSRSTAHDSLNYLHGTLIQHHSIDKYYTPLEYFEG